jgi:hypothetical protein
MIQSQCRVSSDSQTTTSEEETIESKWLIYSGMVANLWLLG